MRQGGGGREEGKEKEKEEEKKLRRKKIIQRFYLYKWQRCSPKCFHDDRAFIKECVSEVPTGMQTLTVSFSPLSFCSLFKFTANVKFI